ncbi:MAG TPA: hypothetical protein VFU22_30840 [Roseiflexaceae bacterium]|nr:hypothetical protein [Roseiflexaceae bacterium]
MDDVALKGLTADFHEPGFVGQTADENNQPFWFQLTDEQRQKAGNPWGRRIHRHSIDLNI